MLEMREKPLILIIDDEADIRDVVRTKLDASGFEVEEAADGLAGIKLALEKKPDVILLDIVMPGIDGVETLMRLKNSEQTKNIRIFLFTGKGDPRPDIVEVNRRFARESGAVDFVRKEIDLNELVAKIQRAVEQTRQDEEFKAMKNENLQGLE